MKYAIIGSALSGNKGAAAMLESSVQTISKEDQSAEFVLLSMYPAEDARLNPYHNLKIVSAKPLQLGLIINPLSLLYRILPPLRPLLRKSSVAVGELAESDVLLDQGGITFVDGREKFLIYNVASILPALFLKVPVIKCAQALGPFNSRINKLAARVLLPKVKLIVARGKITYKHLKDFGLNNVVLGADYAFALEVTKQEKAKAEKAVNMGFFKNSNVVGISPSVVIKKKLDASGIDYTNLTAEFVDWLITDKKYKVALIPHSVRLNTDKTHNNDLPMTQEIFNLVNNKDKCLIVDKELSSQELRYVIGKCDLFVASRFHAMVSSLAMQVPTMVLGWSHKYKEVLDMFELSEFAYDFKDISVEKLKEDFLKLEKSKELQAHNFKKHSLNVKQESTEQAGKIVNLANSSGS